MNLNTDELPAHVPPERVRDFNYLDSAGHTDVYQFFSQLQDGPEIFYTTRNHGHWTVTRFEDIEYILEHSKDFSSEAHTVPHEGKPFPVPLVEYDGQAHTDFRSLLAPFFMPKAVGDLQSRAREFTNSLIDGFYDQGECDFTKDFALKMPIGIMMNLMGLPHSETPYLLELADVLVRGKTATARRDAINEVARYVGEKIIPLRRAEPGTDLFSCLLQGKVDGGRSLTDQEVMGMGVLLVGAGLDTVANMLCFITRFLAENPGHRQQLIDEPALINDALEELLRRFHVANIARMVVNDIDYKGVTLKAGEMVLMPTPLAGIDDRRFPDPWTVDFRRKDKRGLVFGRGPHQCIGAFLGRTELRVFLSEWLRRIPQFEVRPGAEVTSVTGRVISIPTLPIVWKTT